jgi:hypothetical protein
MPAGDLTQGYIFVPAEKSIDQVKMNAIVGQAYINPAFISAQTESTSSTTGDYFLLLKSGGTLAKIVLDNLASSLATTTGFQSQIWSTRLRSWNSVGNPNFEVDQRNVGQAINFTTGGGFICDRWGWFQGGTGRVQAQRSAGFVTLPGTNFGISSTFVRITVTTPQASLGVGDNFGFSQTLEGPTFRELAGDVHSMSLLVRSSVANLKFGMSLSDAPQTKILAKLCTLGAANTWTLITLPNLPVWPTGNFFTAPGQIGYYLNIVLAGGSGVTVPANDTWQASGTTYAAVGQSNFLANAVNSTIDFAFIQHEPGAVCTTLIDKPFTQSLDECLRYYQKSYVYGVAPGTASNNSGAFNAMFLANQNPWFYIPFKKPMAKIPTMSGYSTVTGAVNIVRDVGNGGERTISSAATVGDAGFGGFNISPIATGNWQGQFHYTADTGW